MPLRVTRGDDRIISEEGVREPHLFQLRNGDLLLTFHVVPDMHFAKRICLRSRDHGVTWHPDAARTHREQAMGESDDGTVLAFDTYTFAQQSGTYLGSFYRSRDGGRTFTGPHDSVVHVNRVAGSPYPDSPDQMPEANSSQAAFFQPLPEYYHPLVARASCIMGPIFWRTMLQCGDRWLAPMQVRFHGDKQSRVILMASIDDGDSWELVTTIAQSLRGDPNPFNEPVISETADGSLLCVMRRGGGIPLFQCRSTDGGQTWTEPEALVGHGVDPDLCLLSNQVLACSFGRPGLYVMLSEDGCGFGWGYRTEIGTWKSSTYMGLAEVAPGQLLVVYDRRRDVPDAGRVPEACFIGATTLTIERYAL